MEPVAPVAPESTAPVAAPAGTPAPDATPVETKPERTFSQAELDDIVERRLAKERRKREELNTRLKVTEELALKRTAIEKQELAKVAPTGEPVRGDFGTYEEFIEARADWRADRKVDQKFQDRDAKDREGKAKQEQDTQREQFRNAMKESAKDIEDFDEVIADIKATDPVAKVAASALEAAEAPGRILHYLAKNPDEAERIAGLSPGKQARAVMELEGKLSKPPVKPSKAPEPIKPVGGKATVGEEMPDADKNPDKWMEWRKRQIAARKREGTRAA